MSNRIWAGILLGIVAGNAIGLGSYLLLTSDEEPARAAEGVEPAPVDPASKAHRLAGLDAIERGDYDEAFREFSAGLRTRNPAPDLTQLLAIAQNMREKELARQKAEEAEAAAKAEAPSPAEGEAPAPAPETADRRPPRPALLLVTTRPTRLAIEVDGELKDMSPARIEVEPGRHRVVLRRGKEQLATRTVEVKAGKASLVDADLTHLIRDASEPVAAATEVEDLDDEAPTIEDPRRSRTAAPAASARGDAGVASSAALRRSGAEVTPASAKAALRARRAASNRSRRIERRAARPPPPPRPAIDRSAVRRVAARTQPHFQECYDRMRKRRRALDIEGRVVMRVFVTADGRAERGRVSESTIKSSFLDDCLARATRRMRFPRPRGGPTSVTFALRFQPGD